MAFGGELDKGFGGLDGVISSLQTLENVHKDGMKIIDTAFDPLVKAANDLKEGRKDV